jgi:cell division protein FtsB
MTILRRKLRPVLVPVIGAAVVAYLGYHAVQGEHGFIARSHLARQVAEARETLAVLRDDREHLQHRTELLAPDSIDLDMLDERVRAMLNYGHPDDVVIYFSREAPAEAGPGADAE